MRISAGYQFAKSDELIKCLVSNKTKIYEMYFSFYDIPNGRNILEVNSNVHIWEIYEKQLKHLKIVHENGISLNLLLNGNCYGQDSCSRAFFNKIGNTVDYLVNKFSLSSVTTTSPLIAKFIKANFPILKTRASVNMSIGTVQGMDYISDVFDSYYMKRENNRNLSAIKEMKSWCDSNGKKLFMLANSGCLNHCSAHTFHDNLVSHENEISQMDNAYLFSGICHDYLKNTKHHASVIRDTNFVRPEDLFLYEGYFEAAKLATRVHNNPVKVIEAYLNANYSGAVTDLLEPSHTGILYPYLIENKKIPEAFAKMVMSCDKNCTMCNKCEDVYLNARIKLDPVI